MGDVSIRTGFIFDHFFWLLFHALTVCHLQFQVLPAAAARRIPYYWLLGKKWVLLDRFLKKPIETFSQLRTTHPRLTKSNIDT